MQRIALDSGLQAPWQQVAQCRRVWKSLAGTLAPCVTQRSATCDDYRRAGSSLGYLVQQETSRSTLMDAVSAQSITARMLGNPLVALTSKRYVWVHRSVVDSLAVPQDSRLIAYEVSDDGGVTFCLQLLGEPWSDKARRRCIANRARATLSDRQVDPCGKRRRRLRQPVVVDRRGPSSWFGLRRHGVRKTFLPLRKSGWLSVERDCMME